MGRLTADTTAQRDRHARSERSLSEGETIVKGRPLVCTSSSGDRGVTGERVYRSEEQRRGQKPKKKKRKRGDDEEEDAETEEQAQLVQTFQTHHLICRIRKEHFVARRKNSGGVRAQRAPAAAAAADIFQLEWVMAEAEVKRVDRIAALIEDGNIEQARVLALE